LHLNLKREWFDMIQAGIKLEEYRDLSDYWKVRMVKAKAYNVKTITFSNGYAKDRDQFVIELKYITIRTGIIEWGAEKGKVYFCLHLGNIIEP